MSNIQSETERTAVELSSDGTVKSIVVDDGGIWVMFRLV